MFEKVLSKLAMRVLKKLQNEISENEFYLFGGTALALQIGHRISYDFDFFAEKKFNEEKLLNSIKKKCYVKDIILEKGTLICIIDDVKVSFFYYEVPLLFRKLDFKGIKIADYRDILAEKIKTISQRSSKKDFYDVYSIFKKIEILEGIKIFKRKFADKNINYYHVLKSLTYFEDAENEPNVIALNKQYSWNEVKKFFIKNVRKFEEEMMKE